MKLGNETMVTATFHGFITISQALQLNALYTPTFQISLLSKNRHDLAGYTTTFQWGKCSIFTDSTNIIANHTDDLYILQSYYALVSDTETTDRITIQLVLATGPGNPPAVRVWAAKTGRCGSRTVQKPDPLTLGVPNPDPYVSTRGLCRVWVDLSVPISGSAFRVSYLWSHSDMLLLIVKY